MNSFQKNETVYIPCKNRYHYKITQSISLFPLQLLIRVAQSAIFMPNMPKPFLILTNFPLFKLFLN